jgi:ankyrin repeat protein
VLVLINYYNDFKLDNGDMEIVRMILKSKCAINASDEYGWTPLHIAAMHNDLDMVKALIYKGAYLNALDLNSFTPLALARQNHGKEVCHYLRKNGAKEMPNSTTRSKPLN